MNKKCSVCDEVKPITEFLKDKTKPDGHRADCKECRNKKRRKNYNPEKNRLHSKKWYVNSGRAEETEKRKIERQRAKEEKSEKEFNEWFLMEYLKETFGPFTKTLTHECKKIRHKTRCREDRRNNPEKWAKWSKDRYYRDIKNNRKKNLEAYHRNRDTITAYKRNKRHSDPVYKMELTCRKRVQNALKRKNIDKLTRFVDLIGCSYKELKDHIESQFQPGMTWGNHGLYGWHVDHIKPCASFDLSDPEQQKECFHYSNLQPLWWRENLSKGAKCS